ncbi:MAG: hypothetical protein AMXMBFR59_42800 [Rhodanobacteraceae bacterium]
MRQAGFLLIALALLAGSSAWAQHSAPPEMKEAADFIAQKQREAQRSEIALAPVRSMAELLSYLRAHKTSPFDALSARSRKLFIESLVFTDQGLGSYRYRELEAELSPRQAFELLSLFGAQRTVGQLQFLSGSAKEKAAAAKLAPIFFDDHKGYRCLPPATCVLTSDHICIGANCGMYPP